jgi:hypothetical protein
MESTDIVLDPATDAQREELVRIYNSLRAVRADALTPAIARYVELSETYLFLALTSVGYTTELFPSQIAAGDVR